MGQGDPGSQHQAGLRPIAREAAVEIEFDEVIATRQRLRELSKQPSSRVQNKVIGHIDAICRRFIAACPFVMVASRGADGRMDISPKGDAPGFVAVLDEKTLAIPDRLGNHRLDTLENLLTHSAVGLFFMIPGNGDTLRVSGTGGIVRDSSLQARLAVNGKDPNLVLVVTVEEAFMHCPKCIVRSRLWSPEHWPDRSNVPSLAEAIVAHARPSETVAEVQAIIDDGTAHLY
jgi:PPOX class probable FMN-dependent enzyme